MKDDCYSFYQLWYNLRNTFALSSTILRTCFIGHYSVTFLLCLVGEGSHSKLTLTLFSLIAVIQIKSIILKYAYSFIFILTEIVTLL